MKQYDGERSLINKTVDPYTKLVEDPNVNVNPQLWHLVNWATLQDRLQDRASKVSDLTFIYRVKACFDQNISNLSGAPNVADGVSLSNGDIVLLRGQTNKIQNGVYQWETGGVLSRVSPFDATTTNAFANLNLSFNGVLIHILEGRRYKDEFSYLYSNVSKPIIGTHEIDFVRMPSMKLSQEPTNFLKLDTDGRIWAEIDNSSPNAFGGFVVSGGKLKILEDALPGFAGSLTIEQLLIYIGVASKLNLNDDFIIDWDNTNNRLNLSLGTLINRCFGSGVDGDVVVSSTLTLTANLYARNLTVEPTGVINADGFAIFVSGTLANYGLIRNNGRWNTSTPSANYLGQGAVSTISFSLGGNNSAGSGATPPPAASGGVDAAYLLPNTLRGAIGVDRYNGGAGVGSAGGGGGVVLIAAKQIIGDGRVEARGHHGNSTETPPFTVGAGGGGAIFVVSGNRLMDSLNHFRIDGGHGQVNAFGAFGRIISVQSTDVLLLNTNPEIESVSGQLRRNGLSTIIVTGQYLTYCTHFSLGINRNLYKINSYKRLSSTSIQLEFQIDVSAPLGNTTITAHNRVLSTTRSSSPFTLTIAEGAPFITSFSPANIDMDFTGNITINGSGFTPATVISQTSGSGLTINSYSFVSSTQMTMNVTAGTEHKLFNILASNSSGDSGLSGNNGIYVMYPDVSLDVATVGVASMTGYTRSGATFTKDNDATRRGLEFLPKAVKNLRTGQFFVYTVQLRYGVYNGVNGDTTNTIKIYGYRKASDNSSEVRIRLYKDSGGNLKFVENGSLNPIPSFILQLSFGGGSNMFIAQMSSNNIYQVSFSLSNYDEVEFFASCINDGDTVELVSMTGRWKV